MDEKAKTKWERKREASRATLVDAAMRRFHDNGYAATTVANIVEGTGYSPGAFYFHFKDKAECFWAVVEHRESLRGRWWESVLEGLDPERDSLEEVLARTFAHFDATLEGLNDWVLVMVDFHQQHRDDPEIQAHLAPVYQRWQAELHSFLSALGERGWIAGEADPKVTAVEMFAFAEGLTTHARIYGLDEEASRSALIDGLVRLLR